MQVFGLLKYNCTSWGCMQCNFYVYVKKNRWTNVLLDWRRETNSEPHQSRRNRLWILKVANQIKIAFLLFCLLCLSPFIIGWGKLLSYTEWVETLCRSPFEAERPCWESNAPLWDEKREVRVVMELGADLPCDTERGDNEPRFSLPHSPLANSSHYQCHLLLWLCFVYSTNDDLAGCLSSLLWVVSSNKHVFFIKLFLSYYSIVFIPRFPSIILSPSPNPLNQPESSKDAKRGALADQLMTFKKGQRNGVFSLARDELAASAHQGWMMAAHWHL